MNQISNIKQEQNKSQMLKCQYAARHYFNIAEHLNYLAFFTAILSAICVFLPETENIWAFIVPIAVNIVSLITQFFAGQQHKLAATMRNYFDAVVLGFSANKMSEIDTAKMYDKIECLCSRKHKEYRQQIRNTGRDNPPGVKDWYRVSTDNYNNDTVLCCQKQNLWWTTRLYKRRIPLLAFVIIALFVVVFFTTRNQSIGKVVTCYFSLCILVVDQIVKNCKYLLLAKEIDLILAVPGIADNRLQLEYLQSKICVLREIPVLEINRIYMKHSKHWSKLEEQISRDKW